MKRAHEMRDEIINSSDEARGLCEIASFGAVSQPLGAHTLALVDDFPAAWAPHIKPKLDLDIFPHLMCMGAEATLATFEAQLECICPKTDDRFKLIVGPVKKPARIAVKVREYTSCVQQHACSDSDWPFIRQVKARAKDAASVMSARVCSFPGRRCAARHDCVRGRRCDSTGLAARDRDV